MLRPPILGQGRAQALLAPAQHVREAIRLQHDDDGHEGHAHQHHGDGEPPVGGGNGQLGDAEHGGDKGERQEDHADHGEDLDVVALVNGAAGLLDGAPAEELVAQVLNLLARALVALEDGGDVRDDLFQLGAELRHGLAVGEGLGRGGRGRVRPEQGVRAGPELGGEDVGVGGDHGGEAGVDDGEGVVGPKVPTNVGEVLVLKQELVAEAAIKHEFGLQGNWKQFSQYLRNLQKDSR